MKFAFACPFYGPTPPLVGTGQRANIGNTVEKGHILVEDLSSNGVQHREACEQMLEKASKLDIDALFWTEHDVVLAPDTILRLMEALERTPEADIVTGIVFRRCYPYSPMVSNLEPMPRERYEAMKTAKVARFRELANALPYEEAKESLFTAIDRIAKNDPPFRVDTSHMGCFLMRKSAVDRMVGTPELFAATAFLSIDNIFFGHVRRAGLKLYCAPNVLAGHLADPEVITIRHWIATLDDALASGEARKELLNSPVLQAMVDGHGTDKVRYMDIYRPLFAGMAESARKICEIGVWRGGSLRLWRDFFPNAHVYGIDCDEKREFDGERATTFVADQSDREQLGAFVQEHGSDFDLILDDGGHTMENQQVSLAVLFPHVRPGGYYVVEDVHTSKMFPGWGIDDDRKNTTLAMIDYYTRMSRIRSKYMTQAEAQYVADHIEWATLFKGEGALALTWIVKKRRQGAR